MRPFAFVLLAAFAAFSANAAAQTAYPTKPLRLVVTFTAGGTADLLGRTVGQELSQRLGQPVVIDNKAGAGGVLGSDLVAKAAPDGYTLVLSNAASQASATAINKHMPYDAERDFAHITVICVMPQTFVVPRDFPANTLEAFIAEAKRAPGKINFGTAGIGSMGHFAGELMKVSAGIDMRHVPYKGTAPANIDLIANRVQAMFQNGPEAVAHIRAGSIKLLAVTGDKRSHQFPDTPTFIEAGVPGFVTYSWYGLSAPRGTPAAIVATLNKHVRDILTQPAINKRFTDLGLELRPTSSAEFTRFVGTEIKKFQDLARRAKIAVDQ
jgi:tripartite-type tricarboxylate transporter receptor subunit TctC